MTNEPEALSERDEIEALLPWYVMGTLDLDSRARVERYVKAHPEIRAHLAFARVESKSTIAANEAIPPPSPQALERLRSNIAATLQRQPLSAVLSQLSERFKDWIAGLAPPQFAFATALTALCWSCYKPRRSEPSSWSALQRPPIKRPAAGRAQRAGIELLVRFSDRATIGEIDALLNKLDALVIDGPRDGLYRLRLPDTGDEGRKAAIKALQQSGAVTIVLPGQ